MGVQGILDVLRQAQEIDGEIYRLRQEIKRIPEDVQEFTRLFESEKSHLLQLENQLKNIQLRQKKKEGELNEKESLIRKYDGQLTQVKTNKEYAALQQEIASLKADGSLLEDEIIGVLDEVERNQKEVRQERERLARAEKEVEEKKKVLLQKSEELKANLSALTQKRADVLKQVAPEARELYDKIVEKKEGLALVAVIGEACGACRIELRPQTLNEVKLKESLVLCDHCSRILYHE